MRGARIRLIAPGVSESVGRYAVPRTAVASQLRQRDTASQGEAAEAADLELAANLGEALTRLIRLTRRAKTEAAAGSDGVEATAGPLLAALAESGPMRANALAGAVFSDPSTVSRQVAQLVAAGYVERTGDPADRRASQLRLTSAGAAALHEHLQRRNRFLADVTAGWPNSDRRQIAVLVGRLAADLAAHFHAAAEPAAPTPNRELQEPA